MSNQLLMRRRASCISDKRPNYLKFTALEDGCTLALNKVGNPTDHPTEYSLNKGAFMSYVFGTTINFDKGDTIEWRRAEGFESINFSNDNNNYYTFATSGSIYQDGLITTLLSRDENVTSIGNNAFYKLIVTANGFSGSLILQDGIVSIGSSFSACSGFKGSLYLPDSVTSIGISAFSDCGFDGSLHISKGLKTIPTYFAIRCNFSGQLVIPSNITSIEDAAFSHCKFIGTLEIPDSISVINGSTGNGGSFQFCTNIVTIILPSTITEIRNVAFRYCSSFKYLVCKSTTPPILGSEVFFGCNNFTAIYVPYSADHSIINAYRIAPNWSVYTAFFELDENGNIPS